MNISKQLNPSIIAAALSITLLLSACGDKSSDADRPTPTPNTELSGSTMTSANSSGSSENLDANAESPSDEQLTMQAQALLEEEGIGDVAVQFVDGHATILGQGLTTSVETSVLTIVREMTGVKSVTGKFQHDEVSQESIDSDLKNAAVSQLKVEGFNDIKVNIDNRVATLSGPFPGVAMAQKAGDLITAQEGISRVAMIFTKVDGVKITDADLESIANCKNLIAKVVEQNKIEFESGSSKLSANSKSTVNTLAKTLTECPIATIAVSGHTDSTGSNRLNQQLSENRAQAVAKALAAADIDDSRISASGAGSSRPFASNSTADGRAQNRRIEFTVDL